jgi:hypothetical protein
MNFPAFAAAVTSMGAGLALSSLWQMRRSGRQRFLAEMQRIEWATEQLREHGKALDQFMSLPDVPDTLKTFLLIASDMFETKDFALFMAAKIKAGLKSEENGDNEIWQELQRLYSRDSDAYDLFLQALWAGTTASLLRWSETAPVLSRPFAPTQDYIKREVVTTARAIRENTSIGWPGGLMPV